jgi:glycerol-3-phosphate dehydrogenase
VDVVVVGGGVLGCAVAARLSTTTASVCLLEAEHDVCEGASKGNAGNTISFYGEPGTEENELINASNPGWEVLCRRLDVPFRRIGAVMVAVTRSEVERLEVVHEEIRRAGARAELLTAAQVRKAEPLVTDACLGGVALPDEGIIDPMRLTIGYAKLAIENGVDVRLDSPVTAITRDEHGFIVTVPTGHIRARFLVNAAGYGARLISRLAGGEELTGWPRRGQYVVIDREFGSRLSRIVFCTPSPETKGINVMPTTNGSVLLGPTAFDDFEGDDRKGTDADTIDYVRSQAGRLVPEAANALAIKVFAANRPASDERHRLRFDTKVPAMLHVNSRSAGVSISPAAADMALGLLKESGLDVTERSDPVTRLKPVARLRTATAPQELTKLNPRYGQVVCACEHVSAAEIEQALSGPLPATSVDGVRKRTGAAYGRCQGSLCLAGLSFMTAISTNATPTSVRQTSRGTLGA